MNWYEYLILTPVHALNEVRSNVWSVILVITGITLLLHGHDTAGNSLITGAFAVFRSSTSDTSLPDSSKDPKAPKDPAPVSDPNA